MRNNTNVSKRSNAKPSAATQQITRWVGVKRAEAAKLAYEMVLQPTAFHRQSAKSRSYSCKFQLLVNCKGRGLFWRGLFQTVTALS